MLKKLQKKLDLNWIKKNDIWDIVVYGSYVRGKIKVGDIDIAIIFSRTKSVKEKILLCQELRHILIEKGYTLDVKAVDIEDFLNKGFLGREAILAEGYSIINKDYLAERFGFIPIATIEYSLKNLTLTKQKIFYYALQGRKKGTGFLKKIEGRIISKGVLEAKTKYYEELKELLDRHNISYKTTFTLQYRILH